jgi:hypothetical protein
MGYLPGQLFHIYFWANAKMEELQVTGDKLELVRLV